MVRFFRKKMNSFSRISFTGTGDTFFGGAKIDLVSKYYSPRRRKPLSVFSTCDIVSFLRSAAIVDKVYKVMETDYSLFCGNSFVIPHCIFSLFML